MRSHNDAELNEPRELSTERLGEIVTECLERWDGYPTIPGSLRWRRNGSMALGEILRRTKAQQAHLDYLESP